MSPGSPPLEDYFSRRLLDEFDRRYGGRARPIDDLGLRVVLDGEGGGTWDLEVRGGRLACVDPVASRPSVTLAQTVDDWRALLDGEGGAARLLPESASIFDLLFIEPRTREASRAVEGTVRFEIAGFNGRTWRLTTGFGASPRLDPPEATVSVDAEAYRQLWARELLPPEAYLTGRIRLDGDVGLAMALGMALLPRFDEL